ncbi:MAG: hypothetical protein JOZ62_07445 [Acidobacteriaceae bacterium]|nr:hypothetical protein [Acidobacteriaceae bacterium]
MPSERLQSAAEIVHEAGGLEGLREKAQDPDMIISHNKRFGYTVRCCDRYVGSNAEPVNPTVRKLSTCLWQNSKT